MTDDTSIRARLEYLRGEIHAERISYSEIAELQSLIDHIDPGDTELREWAGLPEFPEEPTQHTPGPWTYVPGSLRGITVGSAHGAICAELQREGYRADLRETHANARLIAAVEQYSRYIEGECYGYTVTSPSGEELDSCWGFIGWDYAKEAANESADSQTPEDVYAAERAHVAIYG